MSAVLSESNISAASISTWLWLSPPTHISHPCALSTVAAVGGRVTASSAGCSQKATLECDRFARKASPEYSYGVDVGVCNPGGASMLTGELTNEDSVVRGEYGERGRLMGVKRVRGDTSGEKRYLSFRSVSVPYPLSISTGRARRCLTTRALSGGCSERDVGASTCVAATGLWTSYADPSSRNFVVSSVQYRTMVGSMTNFAKQGSSGVRQSDGKSLPKTGVSAHRMS